MGHTGQDADFLELIFSLRVKTSLAAPRQVAVDEIVKRALVDRPGGASPKQIEQTFKAVPGMPTLREQEIKSSLRRLRAQKLAVTTTEDKYALTVSAKKTVWNDRNAGKQQIDRCLKTFMSGDANYTKPCVRQYFLRVVADFFAALADECISIAIERTPLARYVDQDVLYSICKRRAQEQRFGKDESRKYRDNVFRFLKDTNQTSANLKFAMAQSYYIAKLIGLGDRGQKAFARELFNNTVFLLDTNVVIPAFDPTGSTARALKELSALCREIGARLAVSSMTVAEMNRVVESRRSTAMATYDLIPPGLIPDTDDPFLAAYKVRKASDSRFTIEKLFDLVCNPATELQERFDVEVYPTAPENELLSQVAYSDRVRRVVRNASPFKTGHAVDHDAAHVVLICQTREKEQPMWFVTADRTLLTVDQELQTDGHLPFFYIIVDLLQVFSPYVTGDTMLEDFATLFAVGIERRLFPEHPIFEAADFQVFADLELDLKAFRPEETKHYLTTLKQDVLKEGTYSKDLLVQAGYRLEKLITEDLRAAKEQHKAEAQNRRGLEKVLGGLQSKIQELETRTNLAEQQAQTARREKATISRWAIALGIFAWVLVLCFVISVILYHGKGDTPIQKLLNHGALIAFFLGGPPVLWFARKLISWVKA